MRSTGSLPSAAFAVAALSALGCATVQVDYQRLPEAEALASLEPGLSRSEVLRRLGPPDEFRRPAPLEDLQRSNPQRRKILEAGDVLGRDAYTYVTVRRTTLSFGILPIGPAVFRDRESRSLERRWRIEFDEHDRVETISHVDEIAQRLEDE